MRSSSRLVTWKQAIISSSLSFFAAALMRSERLEAITLSIREIKSFSPPYTPITGELQREISGWVNSRELFSDATDQLQCRGFTDIQRAARYFVKMRISFGADGRTFGCNRKPLKTAADYLSEVQARLLDNGVVIEHKDFENLIKVYDRPTALFYCDPPYHKTERYYDAEFTEADHVRLKDCLNGIKGRFLLSYNDDDFIRNLYREHNIRSVERANNMTTGKYAELLISNY